MSVANPTVNRAANAGWKFKPRDRRKNYFGGYTLPPILSLKGCASVQVCVGARMCWRVKVNEERKEVGAYDRAFCRILVGCPLNNTHAYSFSLLLALTHTNTPMSTHTHMQAHPLCNSQTPTRTRGEIFLFNIEWASARARPTVVTLLAIRDTIDPDLKCCRRQFFLHGNAT